MKYNILQVSNSDLIGGAARIAWDLHRTLNQNSEMSSKLLVGHKGSQGSNTFLLNTRAMDNLWQRSMNYLANFFYDHQIKLGTLQVSGIFRRLAYPRRYIQEYMGIEDFDFPGTWQMLQQTDVHPDIVHLHNLHTNYFDLRYLPILSNKIPTVCTLHDCWMFTGHCAYYLDCDGWQKGCPTCPYLQSYPPIRRDRTAYNLKRKKEIYQKSKLSIVTPSKWLMRSAEQSILAPAIQQKAVIYNGVDQNIFHPMDQAEIRQELGLPAEGFILLFIANNVNVNVYKDYETIENAIACLAEQNLQQEITFISIGYAKNFMKIGNITIRSLPFEMDAHKIARYYAAADLYLHAAKAENCPLVILEALSCGTPVIATAVGGIPELIEDGVTGYLVPSGDYEAMAKYICSIMDNNDQLIKMKQVAYETAKRRFSLQKMVSAYQSFYEEILTTANMSQE